MLLGLLQGTGKHTYGKKLLALFLQYKRFVFRRRGHSVILCINNCIILSW